MQTYLLTNARPGRVRDVVRTVSQSHGVRHADTCRSLPDISSCVDTPDEKTLNLRMMDETQCLEAVERTATQTVAE